MVMSSKHKKKKEGNAMLKTIIDPNLYHGKRKKKIFFEGWYFKLVSKDMKHSIAIIPGIFMGSSTEESHSFIQFLNGDNLDYNYIKYNSNLFNSTPNNLRITIENSIFSLSGMNINLDEPSLSVSGNIKFNNIFKWPDTLLNPGSMGFYNYLTFMQCYSQVCAMNMDLVGTLSINGKTLDFTGGKGYIEKNWGKSFPFSWNWIQCSSFKSVDASLSCSVGHIPFLGSSFRGFLIGVGFNKEFYKFTTMNKSKLIIKQNLSDITLNVCNSNYALEIRTVTNKNMYMLLNGPRDNEMIPLVQETLSGTVFVKLTDGIGNVIFEDEGYCAGIEYGGNQRLVIDGLKQVKIFSLALTIFLFY
jgi:tocopherol cyclase